MGQWVCGVVEGQDGWAVEEALKPLCSSWRTWCWRIAVWQNFVARLQWWTKYE